MTATPMVGKNFIIKDSNEDESIKTNRHFSSFYLNLISKRLCVRGKETETVLKEVLNFVKIFLLPKNISSLRILAVALPGGLNPAREAL